MTTRAELRARGDLGPDEADDIFELAARLQVADRAFDPARRPLGEGRAIPEHMDVADHFIEDARNRLARRSRRAATAPLHATRPSRLPMLLVSILLIGIVSVMSALAAGRSRVGGAARIAEQQERTLAAELLQQIDRASAVATVAGPAGHRITAMRENALAATDIPEQLVATKALGQEMEQVLQALPTPLRPERAGIHTELGQQVRESQLRIKTSAREWREANSRWMQTTERGLGRLAVLAGLATAPSGSRNTLPRP